MLFLPNAALPPKHSTTGIARGRAASGHWLRSKTIPLNPRSNAQSVWRQVFRAAKLNWQSMGVGGANNAPVNDVDPQAAWAALAGTYFGILQPGYFEANIQTEGMLVGCETVEAFQVMVQATMASLNLAMLPAPAIVTGYLAKVNADDTQTIDGWTVNLIGPTAIDPTNPALAITVNFSRTPLLASPSSLGATAPTLTVSASAITHFYETIVSYPFTDCNASSTASTLTFDLNNFGGVNGLVGSFINTQNYSPAAYNVTNATITASTATSVTVPSAANPGAMTTQGQTEVIGVTADWYTATLTVEPTAATAAGGITLSYSFTDANGTQNGTIALTATTGSPLPEITSPTFAFPNSLSSKTVYSLAYDVTGFALSYSYIGGLTYPMSRGGVALAGLWFITASPAYTSSYSPPSASSWQPILISGPTMPAAASILSAWVEVFGALPDSGDIKFQASYGDPVTGCVGPALSCTATWANGTLKAYDAAAWTGPTFGINNTGPSPTVTAPGAASLTVNVLGANGYSGTITLAVKSSTIIGTGSNSTAETLPAGVTFDLSIDSVTIASGDTSEHPSTLTITAASGAQQFSGTIYVEATDGIATHSTTIALIIGGDVAAQPPANWLSLDQLNYQLYTAYPGTVTHQLTLSNYGPDEVVGSMLTDNTDPDITITFDPPTFDLLAGSLSTPTTQVVTMTVIAVAAATQPAPQVQIEASAAAYTTYASLNLAAPQYGQFNTEPFTAVVPFSAPSTTLITYTVTSEMEASTPVTLVVSNVPAGVTATFASGSVTCPPGSTNSPSTVTDVLTVTVATGASRPSLGFTVTATGPTLTQTLSSIFE
jgi:hypothetical protein